MSYGGLERGVDPLAPAPIEPPPPFLDTYRHFLKPVRRLIATTLIVSLIASVIELSMSAFLSSLV